MKDKAFDSDIEGLRAFQQVKMWLAEEKEPKTQMHRQSGVYSEISVDKACWKRTKVWKSSGHSDCESLDGVKMSSYCRSRRVVCLFCHESDIVSSLC